MRGGDEGEWQAEGKWRMRGHDRGKKKRGRGDTPMKQGYGRGREGGRKREGGIGLEAGTLEGGSK